MISHLRKSLVLSLSLLALFTLAPVKVSACEMDDPQFNRYYRGNLNEDLNDYARMLEDADNDDPNCLSRLTSALNDKITSTPSTQWNTWLYGALIGYAYATGERLVYKGYGSAQLDNALKVIHDNWTMTGRDYSCAKESLNQCVDDFLVASPGWAWSAAYWYRRGNPYGDVAYFKQQALDTIAAGFNEVCISSSSGSSGTYCNGSAADLEVPGVSAGTQSFNHGQRMPSYGYGLITSTTVAALGLEIVGVAPGDVFTADQKKIARALAREMQTYVDPNLEFSWDCETSLYPDANGNFGFNYCGGPDNYSAHMYEQKEAYDRYYGGMPAGAYQGDMNSWQLSQFHLGYNEGGFFSWGRFMTYYRLSHDWVVLFRW